MNNMTEWIKRNASTILTCIGAGGMVATVILAVKATPRAIDKIQAAQIDKGEEILCGNREEVVIQAKDGSYELPKLTIIETAQTCWKDYISTAAVGIGSLACIFGANILNHRQQAALMSAYVMLDSAFQSYRGKANDIFGKGADAVVMREVEREQEYRRDDDVPPWDVVQTFYLEGYPRFFERTMEQVKDAEYHINRNLSLRGEVTFNEFLGFLDLEKVAGGDKIGWNLYDGEVFFGYSWIDFTHRHRTADGMLICDIEMPFPPHPEEDPRIEDDYNGPETSANQTGAIMETYI